jgi:hypothetical protein
VAYLRPARLPAEANYNVVLKGRLHIASRSYVLRQWQFLERGRSLQVVTGVGKHSQGGMPRILPAVVRYLTDAGYRFREEPNNPGVICVLLPGKRNALFRRSPPV